MGDGLIQSWSDLIHVWSDLIQIGTDTEKLIQNLGSWEMGTEGEPE